MWIISLLLRSAAKQPPCNEYEPRTTFEALSPEATAVMTTLPNPKYYGDVTHSPIRPIYIASAPHQPLDDDWQLAASIYQSIYACTVLDRSRAGPSANAVTAAATMAPTEC